ncbi:Y-family DNA polymerase [Paraferrimonas sp. SM1919]|uniref:Y-family DNA polymerase n=1 Tax=Paraferrimonas sp. SM1919 TaxID=2662263 RepID=UPI0013D2366D|nr:Y-family DNA polymerase [Paraferrimonas sp. SM1919]
MYALIDGISFYASCEKSLDPSLRSQPVVVLTNNDGCICAVCPLARKFNIPKFEPYFKLRELLASHNVVIRSSNYALYGELSRRMMNICQSFCDNQYVYSIDECFQHYQGYQHSFAKLGLTIRKQIWQQLKLPVGVGFGPTLTLAKAANHAAKKLSGFSGVAVIDGEISRSQILKQMKVEQVWGVGRRLAKKLALMDIHSAWQLAEQSPQRIRRAFGRPLARTVLELKGQAVLKWDQLPAENQQIFATRTFGQGVSNIDELTQALVSHGVEVCTKARKQRLLIKKMLLFAHSSPHKENYVRRSKIIEFPYGFDDDRVISQSIAACAKYLYQAGIPFYKCGVGATLLESSQYYQKDMFNQYPNCPQLMNCVDEINAKYGRHTITPSRMVGERPWQMQRHFLSPSYLSSWQQLPKINC